MLNIKKVGKVTLVLLVVIMSLLVSGVGARACEALIFPRDMYAVETVNVSRDGEEIGFFVKGEKVTVLGDDNEYYQDS